MLGPIISGERLKLVPPRSEFLPTYCDWFADPDVTRFLALRFPPSLESETQWFENVAKDPNHIHWAVVRADDETLIGNCGWQVSWRHSRAEWGVCVGAKDEWSKGYGREILHLCLCFAFLEVGLEKVTSRAYADNLASIRVHEKEGFKQCGFYHRQYRISGAWRDEWLGELFRTDWEANAGREPMWKPRDS